MLIEPGKLLKTINSPEDLKKFDNKQLHQVRDELRQFIIDNVSVYGGHFGASLGVVELTTALHYVFDTPKDQLIWDVGHQAYGHKILTGRREQFHTNRLYGGLSGFPKRKESEYDTFGVGHSSTSISAALGMAVANNQFKDDRHHIAVIGDGAMTGGMAFEGMNHAGDLQDSNLLIILNDNNMSIDPNVGALNDYLTNITTSKTYNKVKDEVWDLLGKISKFGPNAQELASKIENSTKAFFMRHSNLFESFNLRYFGPVDGHDLDHLVTVLKDLKDIKGPKLLHVMTTKGKGYAPAEKDQTKWHAPGTFDKVTGEIRKKIITDPQPPKFQDVFGHTLVELAKENEKIMGITPAMPSGCSLNIMMREIPDRAFDVGIAEQHAVTFSAGLATQGAVPFCNIYSTFMQRAYDQVIHDVCIQNLHVIFCLDRAGFAGADGPTHHGAYDLAFMRCIPNITVMAPMDEQELRNMMYTAQLKKNAMPFSIRYPRGQGSMPNWRTPMEEIQIGQGRTVKEGNDIAILSVGPVGNYALAAATQLKKDADIAVYDMRFVKPLDEAMLHEVFSKFDKVITVEDGCLMGGFGSAVYEFMVDHQYHAKIKRLGIPDAIVEHGTQQELHKECGFDAEGIAATVCEMLELVPTSQNQLI
ncbi:1-deoxy-D-xylulose-5-phosphate synthase [Persicobacter psychrovividus]|uniref:1-deoxy-D-xylulose-5-phosphate synthase n=1 Tax=Persicobacter psychrovividus TaxID=387638 RepID=A0ABN6L9A1_9BACT|nr:1-deoxy-D-xylulose-5-phosphate synthase [Persicobacter psychrovividus]